MAINKKSTFFVQSSWNFVKIINSCGEYFHQVSWGLDKNCRFFINGQFLKVSRFFCSRLYLWVTYPKLLLKIPQVGLIIIMVLWMARGQVPNLSSCQALRVQTKSEGANFFLKISIKTSYEKRQIYYRKDIFRKVNLYFLINFFGHFYLNESLLK